VVTSVREATWTCPSCGGEATGNHCAQCGEAWRQGGVAPPSVALRLRASLRALASPPGRLTRDWIEGRRVGYLAPLPLFLYTNVAFFLVQWASGLSILSWPLRIHLANNILDVADSLANWIAGAGPLRNPQFIAVFDALEVVHAKALVIVMLPLFALPLCALPLPGRRRYASAFVFSAHFYTYALIAMCALFPLASLVLRGAAAAGFHPGSDAIDVSITSVQVLLMGGYLLVALRTLTTLSRPSQLVATALLILSLWVVLRVYHLIVFAATLMSI
jgi:hypothetical protein